MKPSSGLEGAYQPRLLRLSFALIWTTAVSVLKMSCLFYHQRSPVDFWTDVVQREAAEFWKEVQTQQLGSQGR